MSLMKRISLIFRSKANKALDRAEDPRETLDYSYQRQLDLLSKVRRGVADVATSRKRVELQVTQLEQSGGEAPGAGREVAPDEPRGPRPRGADPQVGAGRPDHRPQDPARAAARARRRSSPWPSSGCQAKVESFRTRKETIKATYTAAEAQTRINEAMSGIGEEMGDVGLAIQRAEDKTAQMQARAGAIDELIASGALDDASAINSGDDITRELESMSSQADVEAELARLKGLSAPRRLRRPSRPHPSPGEILADEPEKQESVSDAEQGRPVVIIRILGEGQYDVADHALDRLNELDAALEAAVEAGDEAAFGAALTGLLDGVRTAGVAHPADSLDESDLILPPPTRPSTRCASCSTRTA